MPVLVNACPNLARAATGDWEQGQGVPPLHLPDTVEPLQGPLYKPGEIIRRCVLIGRDLALAGHYI